MFCVVVFQALLDTYPVPPACPCWPLVRVNCGSDDIFGSYDVKVAEPVVFPVKLVVPNSKEVMLCEYPLKDIIPNKKINKNLIIFINLVGLLIYCYKYYS